MDFDQKKNLILNNYQSRINQIDKEVGIGGDAGDLDPLVNEKKDLVESYDPFIKGFDKRLISIASSINTIKDEIIVLISNAVGTSTDSTCGIASTSRCGISTDGGVDGGWNGGISTCLEGYAEEFYDVLTAHVWPFSSTSDNPFSPQTSVGLVTDGTYSLTSVGIGTSLTFVQDNASFSAGFRVSLGSSATCQTTQTEITRKDGEITDLRAQISSILVSTNKMRNDRTTFQIQEWGMNRAKQVRIDEKNTIVGLKTFFEDPNYEQWFDPDL